jgi:hypothetical protein
MCVFPSQDKSYDTKYSFYEELEFVFDQFPTYHMKNLFGDFNAKSEGELLNRQMEMNETHLLLTYADDLNVKIVFKSSSLRRLGQ